MEGQVPCPNPNETKQIGQGPVHMSPYLILSFELWLDRLISCLVLYFWNPSKFSVED
jgi:hypothetical protein